MAGRQPSCPATREKVIDLYFMEHRAKLIDIAAFLDRFDRAEGAAGPEDFRMAAFRKAVGILSETEPQRAKRGVGEQLDLHLRADRHVVVPRS